MIFDSGSAWINAEGASTLITIPDTSKVPLVVGGIGYFRFFLQIVHLHCCPLPRVNYDKDWWQEIAEVLRTDTQTIDPMNRAQVL